LDECLFSHAFNNVIEGYSRMGSHDQGVSSVSIVHNIVVVVEFQDEIRAVERVQVCVVIT
jgi:hypothetical protein